MNKKWTESEKLCHCNYPPVVITYGNLAYNNPLVLEQGEWLSSLYFPICLTALHCLFLQEAILRLAFFFHEVH